VWDEDFDPDKPGLQASYMAIQVEAWNQVQQSIETQANCIEQPQLLRRYAQACARLQQLGMVKWLADAACLTDA
jgi:hypothetical protein